MASARDIAKFIIKRLTKEIEVGSIKSSELPANGVGWQYNVEGCGEIIAIVTKSGPNAAAQGAVESLLFAADLGGQMVDEALGD